MLFPVLYKDSIGSMIHYAALNSTDLSIKGVPDDLFKLEFEFNEFVDSDISKAANILDVNIVMQMYSPMVAIGYPMKRVICFTEDYEAICVSMDMNSFNYQSDCFKALKLPVDREVYTIGRLYSYMDQLESLPKLQKINVDRDGFTYSNGKKIFLAKPTDKNVDQPLGIDLSIYDKSYKDVQGFYYDEDGTKKVFYGVSSLKEA